MAVVKKNLHLVKMNKQTIPIKGMHCRSCEILIEEKLQEIKGVKKARVSYKRATAEVFTTRQVEMSVLTKAIGEVGYEVGQDKKAWISTNPADYKDLGVAFLTLLFLLFIVTKFGLADIASAGYGSPSNLFVVLIVGLTAGFSTCMALVGGLVLGLSARHAERHPEATFLQKFKPHLFFNLGRIVSYFFFGGLVGILGSTFQLSGPVLGWLTIIVGLVMFSLGLQLIEIFPRVSNGGLTLPRGLSSLLGIKSRHEKEYSHKNSLIVGALTFFLPCGFTQAMQLYAMSTGSFLSGALIMSVFAIGTAPGLLSIGGLTSVIRGVFARRFFKFAGLLVMFLALFNISNGFNLTGFSFQLTNVEAGEGINDPNVRIEDGTQIVSMDVSSSGYTPNRFKIQKDLPTKWIITAGNTPTCANSLISSKLNLKKGLKPGENVIEFTPRELGEIKFSCSMGMYNGSFNVVENKNQGKEETPASGSSKIGQPASTKSSELEATPVQGGDVQVIKATYTLDEDIVPNQFNVKASTPVRLEVDVKEEGFGCMSTILIPGLVNEPQFLEKGKPLTLAFIPTLKGVYQLTCAMGVPRGTITVS